MRPTATRPWTGRFAMAAIAALCLAALCLAAPAHAQDLSQPASPPATKLLLMLPTDDVGTPSKPPSGAALVAAETASFPLGLHFGLSPEEVNARLAHPLPSVAKASMTEVPYLAPAEVDSFTIGLADAGDLKPIIRSCFGAPSRVVFMFADRKLYTISFRFEHDSKCPSVAATADELFQHLLTIPPAAMPTEHYYVGDVDVVDAWDKSVDSVVRRRWRGK
jgi:hypothetical protein